MLLEKLFEAFKKELSQNEQNASSMKASFEFQITELQTQIKVY